jgi:hypothetical protein
VGGGSSLLPFPFFFFLLKPAFLNGEGFSSSGLAFNLHFLSLVSLQIADDVGLLRGRRRLGYGKLLHMGVGIARLWRSRLAGAELAQIQLLYRVGCSRFESVSLV